MIIVTNDMLSWVVQKGMVSPQELGEWSDRVHANDILLNHHTKSVRLVLLITVYVTQHFHAR